MARPTTKKELIDASSLNYTKMMNLVESLPIEEQKAPFNFGQEVGKEAHWGRDKNLRDVFIHLYEWHRLLINWVNKNELGEEVSFLPSPYNWRTYGEMNNEFVSQHQQTSYDDAKKLFIKNHQEVMNRLDDFTDQELFNKKVFSWTGNSTLGSYFVSVTSSHYVWAIKKIKTHIKTYV